MSILLNKDTGTYFNMSNLLNLDNKAFCGRNIPHEKHLFFNIGLEALNKRSYDNFRQ